MGVTIFGKWMAWFRRRHKRALTPAWLHQRCICTEDGIRVEPVDVDFDVPRASVLWTHVLRIEVFKYDLMTTDLICCAVTDENRTVTVNEEMPSWSDFLGAMNNAFGTKISPPDWQSKVMLPAFAENRMTIYKRG